MSERVSERWMETQLGQLIDNIADGGTPSTSNPDFFGGEIPWVVIDDIKPQIFDTETKITALGLEKSSAKLWNKGTVILSTGATIGRVGVAMRPMATKQGICGIVSNEKLDRNYLFHYLVSIDRKLNSLSQGSTIKETRPPTIKKIRLTIPPLTEQKKIATILTSVDEVIETTQKQIDKLQDLKKATMNELLTKGIGHTEFKDSELGRIPEGWDIKKLHEISNIYFSNVDKKSDASEIPVLLCNYMDVYRNIYIKNDIKFMTATAKQREIDKFSLEFDDVIITKDSETPQDIAVSTHVAEELDGVICGYHLAIIRSDKSRLLGGYLSHLFGLEKIQHHFYCFANGSTRFGLTTQAIAASTIAIPPLPEQKKIASIIYAMDEDIEVKQSKLQQIQSLKKSLMQDLLTGKVRVHVHAEPARSVS